MGKKIHVKKTVIIIATAFVAFIGLCWNSYFFTNTKKSEEEKFDTTEDFESALREGYNLKGSRATIRVRKVKGDTRLGFNIWAGDHLNIYPSSVPESLKEGDYLTIQVTGIKNFLFGHYRVFCDILSVETVPDGADEIENRNVPTLSEGLTVTEQPSITPTLAPTNTPTLKPTNTPTPTPTNTPTPKPTQVISVKESVKFSSNDDWSVKEGKKGLYSYATEDDQGSKTYYVFDLDNECAYLYDENDDYYTYIAYVDGDLKNGATYEMFEEEGPTTFSVKFNKDTTAEIEIVFSNGEKESAKATDLEGAKDLIEQNSIVDRSVPTPTFTPTPTPSPTPTNTPTPTPTNTPTPTPTPTNTPTPTPIVISSIKLSLPCEELEVSGEKVPIKVEVSPKEADISKLSWKSSDTSVVQVDQSGNCIAVGTGKATITATAANGVKGELSVTVANYKNVTMRLVATQSKVNDVNIGKEWSYEKKVNGEYAGGDFTVSAGDTLTFYAKCTEDDNWPDIGEASTKYTVTKQDIKEGFSVKLDVYVTENGGPRAGQTAHFVVTFTFSVKK